MSNHTNTEKSLEKNLVQSTAPSNRLGFGEANPLPGNSSGQTHDPERQDANDVIAQSATDQNTPELLGDMIGKWKAIVLSRESLCLVPRNSDMQQESSAVLPIMTIRARIPELDSMLPNPRDLGNELEKTPTDSKTLINLHRRFQASPVSNYTPSPGDEVYVHLQNLDDNDNAGIYESPVWQAPVGGGAVGVGGNGSSGPFNGVNKLGVGASTGDGIGSVGTGGTEGQSPRVRSLEENTKRKHGPPVQGSLSVLSPPVRVLFNTLLGKIKDLGLPMKVYETTRTTERQRYLYTKGRTKKELIAVGITEWPPRPHNGKVTKVHATSNHQFGHAVDLILDINHSWWNEQPNGKVPNGPWDTTTPQAIFVWEEFGKVVVELGFIWGGNWPVPDRPHVELSKKQRETLS